MTVDGYSTKGIRDCNDDSFITVECSSGCGKIRLYMNEKYTENVSDFDCGDFVLCAVSDGVGSSESGGEASATAVRELLYSIDRIVSSADITASIKDTVADISRTIAENLGCSGFATLAGFLDTDGHTYLFNTGDSRAVAVSGGNLFKTEDHNAGTVMGLDPDNPKSRMLTEYLGKINPKTDVHEIPPCETATVYSDGALPVEDELFGNENCETLADKAVSKGSDDNITILKFKRF